MPKTHRRDAESAAIRRKIKPENAQETEEAEDSKGTCRGSGSASEINENVRSGELFGALFDAEIYDAIRRQDLSFFLSLLDEPVPTIRHFRRRTLATTDCPAR